MCVQHLNPEKLSNQTILQLHITEAQTLLHYTLRASVKELRKTETQHTKLRKKK